MMLQVSHSPTVLEQYLLDTIHQAYGMKGKLERLDGYADQNFRLDLADGARFLVKLSRAPITEAEVALMVALESAGDTGFELPRHLRTRDGQASIGLTLDGKVWRLRLLSYLEGTLWAEGLAPSYAQLYTAGENLGLLDRALEQLDAEVLGWPESYTHDWDLSSYTQLVEHAELDGLPYELRESMVECIDFISARESQLSHQLIHNDANDYNLFLLSLTSEFPSGLIDFGDTCQSFAVVELAVAAVYLTDGAADRLEALKQLTLGYQQVRSLTTAEIECLPRFVMLRIIMSRLNYLQARTQRDDDPYVAISQEQIMRQWRAFTAFGLELLTDELIAACYPDEGHVSLAERQVRLAKQGLVQIESSSGEKVGPAALTSDGSFSKLLSEAEDQVCAGESFLAQQDVVLHINVCVTQLEQFADGFTFELHDSRLGDLCLMVHRMVPDQPLPDVEHDAQGIRLLLEGGQKIALTCLWGGVNKSSMRQKRWVDARDWPAMAAAYIDPVLIFGVGTIYGRRNDVSTLIHARQQLLSPTLSHAYLHPLKIVSGDMAYLVAEDGRRYLDMVNNVCHVGHANPRVVEAGAQQMAKLNTNTRYLHDTIVAYSERLLGTLPDHLEVVFLVNSGSEANDLAMRLARQYTKRHDLAVLEHAYHGHLSSLIDISPYKHDGAGGKGTPEHVIKLPFPDTYRGRYRGNDAAERYLADALQTLGDAREQPAALYVESFAGVGGQWIWPAHYIEGLTRHLQKAGTLYIADEVQVGFGRAGSSFWAFEQYAVQPDIVTLGKPIGNGHPIAAVVTTRAIAESFRTGMEYFNTFSGNPVSCAIALAVLEEVQTNNLQKHAQNLGEELKQQLELLATRFPKVGQVRGSGLFVGVEIIKGLSLEPDSQTAKDICHYLRLNGVLLSTDGVDDNVLKIKPPLVIQSQDMEIFLRLLELSFLKYCY
ncbi:aminotransferase class III-fold pyridoxal phosphate-dependent enzyme [Halomonas halocynthiae]|uniref:aminotransferase class III-fold pyridoxal phosphate-dependent enzyme n=1 Tax=Halomonas halocynthiae TaxID=176290 RepID=UPI000688742B|nr:aminotransferase class III-fold pyridoxal phosphate-dependent enzyme [Halomonas halocynthiae]